jgi:cation transport regulator ChaC
VDVWLFGYGSLIWRPDIPFRDRRAARLRGWDRRFWQGSHDHRGVPERPGRVVTLVQDETASCSGMAYLVDATVAEDTFSKLDHREKNGYQRHRATLEFTDAQSDVQGVVYIAPVGNHAYLGPAPLQQMARQIASSVGPSGRNLDYLLELAEALRRLDCHDDHVFELEAEVLKITGKRPPRNEAAGGATP